MFFPVSHDEVFPSECFVIYQLKTFEDTVAQKVLLYCHLWDTSWTTLLCSSNKLFFKSNVVVLNVSETVIMVTGAEPEGFLATKSILMNWVNND